MSYSNQPQTPRHPEPNEEFSPEKLKVVDLDIDLNPDLSDDEMTRKLDNQLKEEATDIQDSDIEKDNNEDEYIKIEEDEHDKEYESSSSVSFVDVTAAVNPVNYSGMSNYQLQPLKRKLEDNDENEINYQINENNENSKDYESPIDWESDVNATPLNPYYDNNPIPKQTKLKSSQYSRLIAYLDEQLMAIQRKHVKSFTESQDVAKYRQLSDVVKDYGKILDFLWYTIKSISQPNQFFQGQYLLKICGDLVDFFGAYSVNSKENLRSLLELLKTMDHVLCACIEKFDDTEKVRLMSITERTRMAVVQMIADNGVVEYKEEVGRIYQGIIELVSKDDTF